MKIWWTDSISPRRRRFEIGGKYRYHRITEKKAKSKKRNKETTENDSAAENDPEPSVLEMKNIKNKKCNKPLQEKGNSADGDKSAISRNILKEQNRQNETPEKKEISFERGLCSSEVYYED